MVTDPKNDFKKPGFGDKKPALVRVNNSYDVYQKRVNGNIVNDIHPNRIFAAGLFVDTRGNACLVVDDQDGKKVKIWNKIPGGNSERCIVHADYLIALEEQLKKMKYSEKVIREIIQKESGMMRSIPERTMIFEMVEETGYYPMHFSFGMDGFRYNTETGKYDIWQVYFIIHAVISPYSKGLEKNDIIRVIAPVRTATAQDADIRDMRLVTPIEELLAAVGPATHKVAIKFLLQKQAHHWYGLSVDPTVKPEFQKKNFATSKRFEKAAETNKGIPSYMTGPYVPAQ